MCGCFSRVSPFCVDIGGCESGAGYMEAPQLSPGDGERPGVPGALEAGGDADSSGGHETAYHGDDGTQGTEDNGGPYDAGAPRFQRPPATDARSDGTPRARYDEGAGGSQGPNDSRSGQSHGVPRSRDDEGPRSRSDEGSRSRSNEGPRGRSVQGPRGGSDEGPWSRSDEEPRNDEAIDGPSRCKGTSTISTEGPRARNDETTLCPNFSEGPQSASTEGPRARNETFDGPGCSEGPKPASSEGPRAWNDKSTISPGCSKGPRSATSEGPRARDDETAGGPSHSKGPRSAPNEGPRDVTALSSCNEEPSRPSDAFPNDADEPDQWPTRGPEGTNGAQSRNEGLNDVSPAQCYDAGAADPPEHGKGRHGSGVLEGAESFKKPVVPCRSSWNEKTLEQRIKRVNAAPSPQLSDPVSSSREAAPDVRARLPPDSSGGSPALPYEEPPWAGWPAALYTLEALKSGSILSAKSLNGASWTLFGRLPTCHVPLEHPSVSRYHAVLQYRAVAGSESHEEPGFYVYDLGSTHGTFINKQRIQAKTFCRFRVGHVLKFGGSSRLFILQGPDEDQDAESELTVTQIKEARRQKESLQKRMLGDDSDEDEEEGEEKEQKQQGGSEDGSCTWGMGEDAEDEETDVNPIVLEYQAEREALYSANPKKALQGFFDREGEELDFEYEERGIGSWLCRVKLPADDSSGKQLLAEVVHSGKKRDAMKLCCLEACRMLDMRGLLRQEAVSRKRKAKRWEAEDFYDSDDDTFLDRTGVVEKKRLSRMKKAGKIEEKPETYESLTAKLDLVEKEIVEVAAKLKTNRQGDTPTSSQDSLDAFMTEIRSGASVDGVTRRKLHLQSLELKKEQQRLKSLIKMVQPTRLPELKADSAGEHSRTKKLTLPMFGAMKGGSKFKLKTGTVGRLPPKRTDLPSSLFTMKGDHDEPEEEEEDEECDMLIDTTSDSRTESKAASRESTEQRGSPDPETCTSHAADVEEKIPGPKRRAEASSASRRTPRGHSAAAALTEEKVEKDAEPNTTSARPKRVLGPGRPPPGALQANYPEDDPDYCVWSPPAGQTGDGKTHLNEKYGY